MICIIFLFNRNQTAHALQEFHGLFQGDMTVHAYYSPLQIISRKKALSRSSLLTPCLMLVIRSTTLYNHVNHDVVVAYELRSKFLSREERFCFEYVFLFHVLFWQKSSSLVTP
jgi:hypothetical protein